MVVAPIPEQGVSGALHWGDVVHLLGWGVAPLCEAGYTPGVRLPVPARVPCPWSTVASLCCGSPLVGVALLLLTLVYRTPTLVGQLGTAWVSTP